MRDREKEFEKDRQICVSVQKERMSWMALRGVLLHKMWMNSNSCDTCYVSICSLRSMRKSLLFIFKYNSYWHVLIKMHASVWCAFVGTHFIISPNTHHLLSSIEFRWLFENSRKYWPNEKDYIIIERSHLKWLPQHF